MSLQKNVKLVVGAGDYETLLVINIRGIMIERAGYLWH